MRTSGAMFPGVVPFVADGSTSVCDRSAGEGDRQSTFRFCSGIDVAVMGTEPVSKAKPSVMVARRTVIADLDLKSNRPTNMLKCSLYFQLFLRIK